MAIRRLDPKAQFKIISRLDDALHPDCLKPAEIGVNEDGSPKLAEQDVYQDYVEKDFDESLLKFNDGMTPDRIVMRALTSDEVADLNSQHVFSDTLAKRQIYKDLYKMYIKMFRLTYIGLVDKDGVQTKPSVEELQYELQVEMGAIQSVIIALGKNRKK